MAPTTRVLWVADKLASDARSRGARHVGGAELTDAAAIAACPYTIDVRRARALEPAEVAAADLIVAGNLASARPELVSAIARSGRHILFEHDVRWCRWRGDFPESGELVHRLAQRCFCRGERWRELVAEARGVIYLTERQRRVYHDNPHYPTPAREVVLGASLFGAEVLEQLARTTAEKDLTAIAWSENRIKGHAVAQDRCRRAGWPVREIRRAPYALTLELLLRSERFVYLPIGLEPAGRMPVEARLLGCEVIVDEHVGVAGEPLWRMNGPDARAFLAAGPARFWHIVDDLLAGRSSPSPARRAPTTLDAARELLTVRRRAAAGHAWLSSRVAALVTAEHVAAPWA